MGRNNEDFQGSSALEEGAFCQQGDCNAPATKHTWKDGAMCSDCASGQVNALSRINMKKAGN